ncbi:MAG: hypothetical protein P0S93_00595, partial [Candidatus Neptunochlamydia sp.]|nr:hypothetical protein [Candidatus Neptunochlamydia sp.]
DMMQETAPFGSREWKTYLDLDVDSPEIPERLQLHLESQCPFFSDKLVKETHILCLIPNNLTLGRLYELTGCKSNSPFLRNSHDFSRMPYWILIPKKIIPSTKGLSFKKQEQMVCDLGYHIPKMLEAAIAILSAKFLAGFSIYSQPGQFTRCQEEENSWPIAIGSDMATLFCISLNDYNTLNGIAGVYK